MSERAELPKQILIGYGVPSQHVEHIAVYLAGNDLIQAAATPSVQEFRRGSFANIFLNNPIPDPVETARFVVSYAVGNKSPEQTYDLLLRTIRVAVPNYPDKIYLQTLVILNHGEAGVDELLGNK